MPPFQDVHAPCTRAELKAVNAAIAKKATTAETKTLPKLAEVGAVRENFIVKYGKVAIFKVPSAHPKNK